MLPAILHPRALLHAAQNTDSIKAPEESSQISEFGRLKRLEAWGTLYRCLASAGHPGFRKIGEGPTVSEFGKPHRALCPATCDEVAIGI